MEPGNLATFTKVGVNRAAFEPSLNAITEKYFEKFRGAAGASEEPGEERGDEHE